MARQLSAGILLYRKRAAAEVLLLHPGGPYWAEKDDGAWSLPKGLVAPGEEAFAAARREFGEETGCKAEGDAWALGEFKQPSGKIIAVWAMEGDCHPSAIVSNTFEMIWPPKSGRIARFPEIDRAAWFDLETARRKIVKGQKPIIDEFERLLPTAILQQKAP